MAAPMSDVTGYRTDGGALGQDQGLGGELRKILTAKLPLLNAPGSVLENSLYYDVNSSSVTAVEEQATFAKDRITLNNNTYGSSPSAYIPSVLFAGTVYWCPQLPSLFYPPNVSTTPNEYLALGFCLPHGWGFWALQNIIVYMGASSIAQIQISAQTNFLINMATCESISKRNTMLTQAGQYLNNLDTGSVIITPTSNKSIWTRKINASNPFYVAALNAPDLTLAQAIVPIRLPWSSMAVLEKRLSIDTKLSTQPIQITLQTSQLSQFMSRNIAWQLAWPNTWASSTLQLWQEELSDKSLSVRNELLAMPEFNVGYPFQYAQSIPFEVLGSDTGETSQVFNMNITSIINSDLTTFLFFVTWDGRTNPSNGVGQLCPSYGERLENIELLLNGQRFFFFDQNMYSGATLGKQLDNPNVNVIMPRSNVQFAQAATTSVYTESNIYEFNNSRLRSIVAESHMQNTARFTNQTFQMRFQINRDINYYISGGAGSSKAKGYTLHMCYLYNAVFLVGGDGGTTKLITN